MWKIFFVVLGVFFLFLFFRYRKKAARKTLPMYICDQCGERDCVCHKQADVPDK